MKWIETNDNAIIATENGLTKYMKSLYPDKNIVSLSVQANCKNMKKTNLENLYLALLNHQHVIKVSSEIAAKAKLCITRMLEL